MSLWYDIFVAHISIGETNTGLAIIHPNDSTVSCSKACAEELGSIVWNYQIRTFHTIEVLKHIGTVSFGPPTHVGIRHSIDGISTITAHTINLLDIIPFGQLGIKSHSSIVFHADFILIGFLGSDKDYPMAGTTTIKSRCRGSLQYRHALNVIGIYTGNTVAKVKTTISTGATKICIIQRHAVYHIQRLVITGHFCATT